MASTDGLMLFVPAYLEGDVAVPNSLHGVKYVRRADGVWQVLDGLWKGPLITDEDVASHTYRVYRKDGSQ